MLREYSHNKSESLAQICVTIAETQKFSLAHPVYVTWRVSMQRNAFMLLSILKLNTQKNILGHK